MQDPEDTAFLDLLYAAAAEPTLWVAVLERFAAMVGGGSAFLSAFDLVSGQGASLGFRIDPDAADRYDLYYAARNPLNNVESPAEYLRHWRPRILTDQDLVEKSDLARTEYYNDFMLRHESHAAMMVRLGLSRNQPIVLNINRPRSLGDFERADVERAGRFHPHLIRAFDLSRKFAAALVRDGAAGGAFEDSPHGLLLVTGEARILRANAAAEALLRAATGLRVRDARLSAARPGAASRLHAMIGVAGASDAALRTGDSMVVVRGGGAAPLLVTVTPVRDFEFAIFQEGPCVLVGVTDPDRRLAISERRLAALFGLTPAEARVARALVDHGDLPRAAERLGIGLNTAKTHLARVYAKTGADRQASLAALIARCSGPEFG